MPQKLPEGGSGASFGGGNRARTGGPELAKLVLYQLSYAPLPVSTQAESPMAAHLRNNLPTNFDAGVV